MPLHEYECERCEHRFEVIQKFSDPPVETCPKCGGPVRKLMASPAIQFKGSGWYVTDYARGGATKETRDGKDGKDGKDAKGGKESGETKDAKTGETKPSAPSTDSSSSTSTTSKKDT